MPDPKTPTPARAKAPGPDVVEALANPTAAGAVGAAIETATAALRREFDARDGGLAPMERWTLDVLDSHRKQLETATTVPAGGPS